MNHGACCTCHSRWSRYVDSLLLATMATQVCFKMDVCSRVDGAAGGTIGKGCCRTMKIRQSLAKVVLLMMLGACTGPLRANPYAAFIVHCEPRNADGGSLLRLREMVQKADEHQVKLTIDFTPPWHTTKAFDTMYYLVK